MILACNELPEIPSNDGGVWRRLRVIEFSSRFCENPDPEKPNEFAMDLELSEKFDRYSDYFLSMLIERHKNINPNKIIETREVINATQKYKDNNDIIGVYKNLDEAYDFIIFINNYINKKTNINNIIKNIKIYKYKNNTIKNIYYINSKLKISEIQENLQNNNDNIENESSEINIFIPNEIEISEKLQNFINDIEDIVRAYRYLGIEASDIQPDNLGYSSDGKLKAFDIDYKNR
jgi:hypothetical protein